MRSISKTLRAVFESLTDSVFLTDETGLIIYANSASFHNFIIEAGFLNSKKYRDFVTNINVDAFDASFASALLGNSSTFPTRRYGIDGKVVESVVTLSKIVEGADSFIMILDKDYSVVKRSEKIQNALFKISESINTTQNLDTLYPKIQEIVSGLMPVKNFYIALYDSENDLLHFPYYIDEFDIPPSGPEKARKGLTEYVIRTGMDMLVDDVLTQKMEDAGDIVRIGEPSKIWLGVALKLMDKTIGVIVVQDYKDRNTYGEEEKQILIFVSEQIALAIEKKRTDAELKQNLLNLEIHKNLLLARAEELTNLNYQLGDSETKLRQLNADKDKFFSIISHDLKGSFTALLGLSEFLYSEIEDFTKEEIVSFSHNIYKSSRAVYNLLENLLLWSRIQTGRITFVPANFSIEGLIIEIIDVLQLNANSKNIKLVTIFNDLREVYADKEMINTALRNLVANAIKFTREGGKVTILTDCDTENNVLISVIDTGIGIKQEHIEKLFRIDVSVTTLGTNKEKGSGLGLILCKEFVEKNGGKIFVESILGEGTVFKFTLIPAAEEDPALQRFNFLT